VHRFNSGFASRDYRQQHQHRPTGAAVVPPMPNPMVFNPAAQPPQPAAPQQASFLYSGAGYGNFYQQQPAVAGWWGSS